MYAFFCNKKQVKSFNCFLSTLNTYFMFNQNYNKHGGSDGSTLALDSMQAFKRNATTIILIVGLISFVCFGLMEYKYYETIFSEAFKGSILSTILAIALPIILELGRFGFLLASAVDMATEKKDRKSKVFVLFTVVPTILICAFQTHECWAMIDLWQGNDTMFWVFLFLIYFGFIAELKLISLMYE